MRFAQRTSGEQVAVFAEGDEDDPVHDPLRDPDGVFDGFTMFSMKMVACSLSAVKRMAISAYWS